jgi:hypothetical protein
MWDGMQKVGDWKAAATGNRCVLCFGRFCDPLPIPGVGIGSGWPLGGPSVAQGPPRRRPREAQASIWGSVFVCNENKKVAGGGGLSRLKAQAEGRERLPKLPKSPELKNQRRGHGSQARVLVCHRSCRRRGRLRSMSHELSQARVPAVHRFGCSIGPSRKSRSTGLRDSTRRHLSS